MGVYMKFNEKIIRICKLERPGEVEALITTTDTTSSEKEPDALRNSGISGDGETPPGPPAHHLGLTSEPPPDLAEIAADVVGKVDSEKCEVHLQVPGISPDEKRKTSKNSSGSTRARWSLTNQLQEEGAL